MFRFFCENCTFETNDEAVPDCPICGGFLRESENAELRVPKSDEENDEGENYFGLSIE
ncbi:MAG: hypothetical protein PHW50_01140 [Patescibacteria group bacterium]|nr:hypothetical protein [Patescibacteria group bacterium]